MRGGGMMELRNCPVCGKLFVYTVRNLCPECAKKDEENFEKVRQYLYDVPQATLEEIAEKTGVPAKNVLEYLKEGRLMLKKSNLNILSCEMCGSPILTGRYCEKCAKEMKEKMDSLKHRAIGVNEDMRGTLHLSKLRKREK
jgi:flagellar operon protein (TIGR03826 family)